MTTLEKALRINEPLAPASNLFRIANAVCSLQEARETFELYIANIDDPRGAMVYLLNIGYLYNLRYYRDHKDTSKLLKQRIDNIANLGFAVDKIGDQLEKKDAHFYLYVQKIREALKRMCLDAESLLQEELINWNLAEYLSGIKEENKVEYIKTALSIPHGKGYSNLPQVILDTISNSTFQAVVA